LPGGRNPTNARVAAFQPSFIGLHRAIEGKEIRVLAIGLGKNAVSFRIAVAPRLVSLALRVATTTTSRSAVAVIVCAVSEPLARYSAASRARSLCIRLKTFSEIWRGRSGAADSHIDGGAAEVAAYLVHPRADLDHEIGAIVAHDFRHVRVA
jgi:hypothetical protein